MVQVIENWTKLRGQIIDVEPDTENVSFLRLSIAVEDTQPVNGFANLVAESAGAVIRVAIPRRGVNLLNVRKGRWIELQVRSTPKGFFAHPDKIQLVDEA